MSEVFIKVNPSVVVILTKERGYFKEKPGETLTSGNLGSGFVISRDGLIMTAAHVVQVADEVTVQFLDGTQADAKVVGVDKPADVALLKLDSLPAELFVAKLGDSDQVKAGDQEFFVGGDIVLAVQGIPISLDLDALNKIREILGARPDLTNLEFKVLREGKIVTLHRSK
ncbi:MAG: S1C family serine protease [Planctomycetota bacterium]